MTTSPPDCSAFVAALLAQGHTPPGIERAIWRELQRQTAGRWRRTSGGDWYTQTEAEAAAHLALDTAVAADRAWCSAQASGKTASDVRPTGPDRPVQAPLFTL